MVSELFDASQWDVVPGFEGFTDVTYHRARAHGTVRVAFDRPEVRNAFRPRTVDELFGALEHARTTSDVGCVLITGNGPSPKDGGWAFSSGGDQRIRGADGYKYEGAAEGDPARLGRLHILEVQRLIRFMPKIVIAVVGGWAVGGGHSLHVVCDMTLASREHAIRLIEDCAHSCGIKWRGKQLGYLGEAALTMRTSCVGLTGAGRARAVIAASVTGARLWRGWWSRRNNRLAGPWPVAFNRVQEID